MFRSVIYFASLLLYLILYILFPNGMSIELISFSIILVVLLLILFFTTKEKNIKLKKKYLKHSFIFLLGYVIVHFQYYLDFALGNTTILNRRIWVDTMYTNTSIILCVLGLSSFLLGYELFRNKTFGLKNNLKTIKDMSSSTFILKCFSFISLVIFFITINPLYFLGMYASVEKEPITIYAEFAFSILVFANLIQTSLNILYKGSSKNITIRLFLKEQGLIFNVLVGIYLLGVLLSGDRGPIIYIGLCYLINFIFITKFKIKLKTIIVSIIVFASFISILGQVRLMDKDLSFDERFFSALSGEYENPNRTVEPSISPSTKELAGSIKTLQAATFLVPLRDDYFYGRFQLQYIIGAIPFGTEFKNMLFEDTSYKNANSGKFITWHLLGEFRTYELGTSCIADLYLDLGAIGVTLGMFLFGIFLRYCELVLYIGNFKSIHLFSLILSVVYLAYAIYIPRSMLLFNLKFCVFIYLLLSFNRLFFNKSVASR